MLIIGLFFFFSPRSLAAVPVSVPALPAVADNEGLAVIYLSCSVEAGMQIGRALGFGK